MTTDGLIFQPCPRSRPGLAPVPSVAIPPLPFSPVKFSGLIEKVFAFDSLYILLRSPAIPLYGASCANADTAAKSTIPTALISRRIIGDLLFRKRPLPNDSGSRLVSHRFFNSPKVQHAKRWEILDGAGTLP